MTRLEELTLNLSDDLLTGAEARELAALLAQSEQARQAHIQILQIEGVLRGRRPSPDVSSAVMEYVRRQVGGPAVQDVMEKIKALPVPAWSEEGRWVQRRPETGSHVWLLSLAARSIRVALSRAWLQLAAGLALLALVLGITGSWFFGPSTGLPTLTEVEGTGSSIERGGQSLAATAGTRLEPGDVLRTSARVTAAISFAPEHTRLTLGPGTELLLKSGSGGKHFELRSGKLEASVARQRPFRPMVLRTGQAEARVLGTRFTLTTTSNATRLTVMEGKVRFTRVSDSKAVRVAGGEYAVAAMNCELAALPFTGSIRREWWSGVAGQSINDLRADPRFTMRPDAWDLARVFELEPVKTNGLGVRFRGYLHPPVTGDFEFWLATATDAILLMSPSENTIDLVPIAKTQRTVKAKDWDAPRFQGPSQWSSPIPLVAGRRYYLEALVLIDRGEGHLSVAWKPPGGSRELLTGDFLSPFKPK